MTKIVESSLVLLSGGADSTIAALIAKESSEKVHALTLNYGQKHHTEIAAATQIAKALNLDGHEVLNLPPNILKGSCGLIDPASEIPAYASVEKLPTDEVAKTFLPLRNQLFITIAMNRVFSEGFERLYIGVSETDYSGYPDCRNAFIRNIESATVIGYQGLKDLAKELRSSGFEQEPIIHAPLMFMDKKASILKAVELTKDESTFEKIFEMTHTCYHGVKGGCGECAACLLRDRGFEEARIPDPIWKFRKQAA